MLDAKYGGWVKGVAGKRKEVRSKRREVEGNATRMQQAAWCNTEESRVCVFSFSWRLLRGQSAERAIIKRKGAAASAVTDLAGSIE
jgi:hypothetical protein